MKKFKKDNQIVTVGGYVDIDGIRYASVSESWLIKHGFTEIVQTPYTPTEEEINRKQKINRIKVLKQLLTNSDYKAIKYAEGLINEEEYASIKEERQNWRNEINELENELYPKVEIKEEEEV